LRRALISTGLAPDKIAPSPDTPLFVRAPVRPPATPPTAPLAAPPPAPERAFLSPSRQRSRDICAQTRFINEDEARRIDIELSGEPVAATLQKVGALLLQCRCGLFLNVQARLRSQTSSAPQPMETALSSRNRRTISLRAMSFASSIIPTLEPSWASRREPPRRPCFAGVNRPARVLAIQAIAVEPPTPKSGCG